MNRSPKVRVAVFAAASLAVAGHALALCPGGVTAFGFENCPLGSATLSVDGFGHLVVAGIGSSGNDGVEMRLNAPPDLILAALMEFNEPAVYDAGAYIDLGATGVVDDAPDSPLLSTRLTRENVNSSGFLFTVTIEPDFQPIGSPTFDATVTSNGVVVLHSVGLDGRVLVRQDSGRRGVTPPILRSNGVSRAGPPAAPLRGVPQPLFQRLGWDERIEVLLPGEIVPVAGDAILFSATGAAVSNLSTMALTAADISFITITNEDATAPAPIPTVSEWGLIVLTILLLGSGIIVMTRSRATAATGPR